MVRQLDRAVPELRQRRRDQLGHVEGRVPPAAAVVDDAGDDGGQAEVAAGLLLADQVLVGVGDVAQDAGAHGGVDPGLEFEEQDHEAGLVAEVDAPEHVGLSAGELGADALGRELARRGEVELVDAVGGDVVFEDFGDGGGLGEEELVDFVVLAAGGAGVVDGGVGQRGPP